MKESNDLAVASTDLFGGTPPEAMQRGADISPCGRYRYSLWRKWGPGATCMFVGRPRLTLRAGRAVPNRRQRRRTEETAAMSGLRHQTS